MAEQFNFEVFDKRSTPLVKRPEVTVQASGSLSLNRSAYHALGEPKTIELLYERERRIVGFRAVDENAVHAYPIRGFGTGNTFIVSGRAFFAFYNIPFGSPVRREAKMVNGVLIIDLNDPGREATSNRNRKKQRDSEQALVGAEAPIEAMSGVPNTSVDTANESQEGSNPEGLRPALADTPGRSLLPGSATGGSAG